MKKEKKQVEKEQVEKAEETPSTLDGGLSIIGTIAAIGLLIYSLYVLVAL